MIAGIKLKHLFNPVFVIFITCALFATDYFKINPNWIELHSDPVFWTFAIYWTIALVLFKSDIKKKNASNDSNFVKNDNR